MTDLPIDIVPNTRPSRLRWRQTVTTLAGTTMVQMEGRLPAPVESAVIELIALVKRQAQDIIDLRRRHDVLVGKIESLQKPQHSAKHDK